MNFFNRLENRLLTAIELVLGPWLSAGQPLPAPAMVLPHTWTILHKDALHAVSYTIQERKILMCYPVVPHPTRREFYQIECPACRKSFLRSFLSSVINPHLRTRGNCRY